MSSKLQLYNIKIFFSKQNTSYSFPRTTHNRFFFEKTTRDGVRNRLTQREKQALYSQHFTFRSFIITAGRELIFSERFERKKRVLETRLHSYGGVRINRSEVSLSLKRSEKIWFLFDMGWTDLFHALRWKFCINHCRVYRSEIGSEFEGAMKMRVDKL